MVGVSSVVITDWGECGVFVISNYDLGHSIKCGGHRDWGECVVFVLCNHDHGHSIQCGDQTGENVVYL